MGTLNSFAAEHGITFPLISDKDGKLKSLYSSRRINYLIDMEGTVRVIQKGVPANKYFIEKIKSLGL
jgi:peroxiredoxin Q/BCP